MCVGPLAPPKPPKLPETPEVAPRPEKTAKSPTIGSKRKSSSRTGLSRRLFRRGGTASLRIPKVGSGRNLNY